jgi:hypothetical protein
MAKEKLEKGVLTDADGVQRLLTAEELSEGYFIQDTVELENSRMMDASSDVCARYAQKILLRRRHWDSRGLLEWDRGIMAKRGGSV